MPRRWTTSLSLQSRLPSANHLSTECWMLSCTTAANATTYALTAHTVVNYACTFFYILCLFRSYSNSSPTVPRWWSASMPMQPRLSSTNPMPTECRMLSSAAAATSTAYIKMHILPCNFNTLFTFTF